MGASRQWLHRVFAVSSMCWLLSSCASTEGDCIESALSVSPIIRVVDDATGQPICDAKLVTFRSGREITLLPAMLPDASASCQYGMGGEPGNYMLIVAKPGYRTMNTIVAVENWDPCSGSPPALQPVTIALISR